MTVDTPGHFRCHVMWCFLPTAFDVLILLREFHLGWLFLWFSHQFDFVAAPEFLLFPAQHDWYCLSVAGVVHWFDLIVR